MDALLDSVHSLGYRFARLDRMSLADQDAGGPPDYTGPSLQVGLAYDAR